MRILFSTLIVLFLSILSVYAAPDCKPGSCVDQSPAQVKGFAKGKNLVCFNFKQAQPGKVIFSVIGEDGRAIQSWNRQKDKTGSFCIPRGYFKKAKSIIVCGCYTRRWTKGNSWRLVRGTSDEQYFSRKRGGSARLNLCPPR